MATNLTVSVRTESDGLSGRLRVGRSAAATAGMPSWLAVGVPLALLAPLALAIAAAAAQGLGVAGPQHLLSAADAGGLGAAFVRAAVWLGPAAAVAVSALAILRVRVSRDDALAAEVTVRLGVIRILVFAAAVVLAAVFYGHIAADALGCANGLRSAC
jgi:hypothetical protein